jgi:hypothetical protein
MKKAIQMAVVSLAFAQWATQAAVTALVETGVDSGRFSIIEPQGSPNGTFFGEDAWMFTDRTHEYNGPAFDASGNLLTTSGGAIPALVLGLPRYLLSAQYIANANNHRDNAAYTLTLTLDSPAILYLLVDNRLGDSATANPPTLGSGGTGLMSWVADMGFQMVNTGLSPNGQPDFVGADEGGQLTPQGSFPELRTHGTSGLETGPGQHINQYYSVYRLDVPAGDITLKEQNGGSLNMYGVVVVPEPQTWAMGAAIGLLAFAGLKRRFGKA